MDVVTHRLAVSDHRVIFVDVTSAEEVLGKEMATSRRVAATEYCSGVFGLVAKEIGYGCWD